MLSFRSLLCFLLGFFRIFDFVFVLLPCMVLFCFLLFYGFLMVAAFHASVFGHVSSINGSVVVVICAGEDRIPRFISTFLGSPSLCLYFLHLAPFSGFVLVRYGFRPWHLFW